MKYIKIVRILMSANLELTTLSWCVQITKLRFISFFHALKKNFSAYHLSIIKIFKSVSLHATKTNQLIMYNASCKQMYSIFLHNLK